jgi:hypothetical protein
MAALKLFYLAIATIAKKKHGTIFRAFQPLTY